MKHTWGGFQPIRGKHIGPGPDDYELLGGEICKTCKCANFWTTEGTRPEFETCEEGLVHSAHEQ